jgi:hypothetical protein
MCCRVTDAADRKERPVSLDAVSAYTLVVGDEAGPAEVQVFTSADDAWHELDAAIRDRCGMRPRPNRVITPEAAARLADAWRAAEPDARYWQVQAHRLPILLPAIALTESRTKSRVNSRTNARSGTLRSA